MLSNISGLWGLGLNETTILLAIILVVLDFFVPTDLPTHLAYILLSVLVAYDLPLHPLYRLLCGLLAWFLFVGFHYFVWRNVLSHFSNRFIAPTRYRAGPEGLVGLTGKVRELEGKQMLAAAGDLWSFQCPALLAEGDDVKIVEVVDGQLHVVPTVNP